MTKRAVAVAIDEFSDRSLPPLSGCEAVAASLTRNFGFRGAVATGIDALPMHRNLDARAAAEGCIPIASQGDRMPARPACV